jgi:hypothetical protein
MMGTLLGPERTTVLVLWDRVVVVSVDRAMACGLWWVDEAARHDLPRHTTQKFLCPVWVWVFGVWCGVGGCGLVVC